MTNKPDIAYRLTTSTSITKDELLEAANEIVDLREKIQLLELQYSVLLGKYENATTRERNLEMMFTAFCDNCGDEIPNGMENYFSSLPQDIASANAGESATVCRKCNERIEADCNNGKFRTTDMS